MIRELAQKDLQSFFECEVFVNIAINPTHKNSPQQTQKKSGKNPILRDLFI